MDEEKWILSTRGKLFQLSKIVISLGLITFLIIKISPQRIIPQLKELNPSMLIFAFLIFFFSNILGSMQWHFLLHSSGIRLRYTKTFRLYFIGLFFNNFLPANVGGDAVKIYDVTKIGNDPYRVFAVTLLDRVIGITALSVIALGSSFYVLFHGGMLNLGTYMLVFSIFIVPLVLLSSSKKVSKLVRKLFSLITIWGIGNRFDQIFDHLGEYKRLRSLLLKLSLLSLAVQALRITTHIFVAKSLNISIQPASYIYFFIFIPLLGLIMILPISINGLGVREGTGILLFSQIGFSNEQSLLMEFITYFVMVVVSLLGAGFFLTRNIGKGSKRVVEDTGEAEECEG